jgi:hypothetical protein
MAAVLACGPRAFLSDRSAGALLEVIPATGGPIDVSVGSARCPRARAGIRIHRRRALTLLDLTPSLSRNRLEAAIGEADKRDLTDPESLRQELERFAGRPGIAALRDTLDRHPFTLTDSELERRFLPLARQAGLPPPLTQQPVNGFRVDFYWPELGLVAETDGLRYHRTPAQQARDRLRDQVRFEPDRVRSVLEAVAARF